MKTAPVATALFLVLAFPLGPISAQAQDARAQARVLFGQGVERYQAGDHRAALESFLGAYRVSPHPSVRVNIANCYEKLELPVQALFHFEGFLEEAPSAAPAQRREVQRAMRRLRQRVGEVTMRIEPPGATVVLDGGQPRQAPIEGPVRLAAGRHSVEVRMSGFSTVQREFEVRGGELMQFEVGLAPVRRTEGATGAVEASADTSVGTSSQTPGQPAGAGTGLSDVEDGDEGGGTGAPVWIAGGATVAVLAAGAITGVLALGADSDFEDAVERSNDRSLRRSEREAARLDGLDAADRADMFAIVTDVLLIGGVIGLGVTVYLLLTDGDDQEAAATAQVDAVPVALPGGGALFVNGAF